MHSTSVPKKSSSHKFGIVVVLVATLLGMMSIVNYNSTQALATSGLSGHDCEIWSDPSTDRAGSNDKDDRCDEASPPTSDAPKDDHNDDDECESVVPTDSKDHDSDDDHDGDDDCNDPLTPTVVSIAASGGTASSAVGECGPITVTFTLSEPSTDFVSEDVDVTNGSLSSWVAVNSTTYTATFTPPPNSTGTAKITVKVGSFTNASGVSNNAGDSLDIVYDTVAPTVAITRAGSGSLGVGGTSTITFTLSEPSTDFVSEDVDVTNGSLGSWVAFNATTYTATFTPTPNATGSAVISVAVGSFSDSCNLNIQNPAGDTPPGSNSPGSDSLSIDFDTRTATVTSDPPAPTGSPTPPPAPTPTTTTTAAPSIALPSRGAISTPAKKSLTAKVLFGLRSAELTPQAKAILKGIAAKVSKSSEISVEIVGAVQESKNAPNVNPLSTNRANAVRDYLRSLKVNGTYTIKIIGIVGDTPAARRATLSVFYS